MATPHELLGISERACVEDVRKAYRALARRWHPDRFMPGPEREWASMKMTEINAAYTQCLANARKNGTADSETETLMRARKLIDDGNYTVARELLMTLPTRCAEWNYLFGALLMRLQDVKKALIYLTVAAHQQPQNEKYRRALEKAHYAARK